jgi:hypothetical protein
MGLKPDLKHSLEVAKPLYLGILKNLSPEYRHFIRYSGYIIDNGDICFRFQSSLVSLSFQVYAGLHTDARQYAIAANTNYLYSYFSELKNEIE